MNIKGPREISILRKSAVPILYGPNSECLKSTWYGQTGNDPKKCSIHMTRDFNGHRLRRRAWDRGFSIKGMYVLIRCTDTSDIVKHSTPTNHASRLRQTCSRANWQAKEQAHWMYPPGQCTSVSMSWVRSASAKTSTISQVVSSILPSRECMRT
jgi:hypothetical protein